LVSSQIRANTAFEERIDKEVRRIREEAERDVASIRAASQDVAERECRMLRDVLESVRADLDSLQHKWDICNRDNLALAGELTQVKIQKSNELAEIRAELKLKAFECTSLSAKYEVRYTH